MAEIVMSTSSQNDDPTAEIILKHLDPSTYFRSFLSHAVRMDGRGFSSMRNVTIKTGTIGSPSCYGSSLVSIGGTSFSTGITLQVGAPSYQRPDCGDITFEVNLWSLASVKYEQRSKPDAAFIIESMLEDIFLRGNVIDLKQLCIQEGKTAYRLSVSLVCLSDCGNLVDAAVLSAITALSNLSLPKHEIESGAITVLTERGAALAVSRVPVSVTCAEFEGQLLVDPTDAETETQHGSMSCCFDENGQILSLVQAGEGSSWTPVLFAQAVALCRSTSLRVRESLLLSQATR